ncbi:chromosomal replication initiator protein DnaA [Chlamydiifrater phoenicopteri]|uniref:chromosomal replication initiator protein DnaA n=1 Tax=Chlamydiifrater phoenicopteri TaxID=2681469 RepID=UPI001BCD4025|nr:chromosomal replication initiator protein DnaA [Chlamydiifrater phoenicopteri]
MRAWEEFLLLQDKEIGKEIVDKWLRSLKVSCFDACNLYLEASDSFQLTWFEEHIRHKVKAQFVNNNGKAIRVHISSSEKSGEGRELAPIYDAQSSFFSIKDQELDENKTFANFLITPENEPAFRILKNFGLPASDGAEFPFNPIYLFGVEGAGKTHLMQSVAHELKNCGKKVLFVDAERFTEHLVAAIRAGEMQKFRSFYRKVDALFIEDIEVFSRKAATQEEFFHTFNSLHTEGKLIMLSSLYAPGDLKFMEERLVSRFEWGIVIPVQSLVKDGLRKFIYSKSQELSVRLHESSVEFLIQELVSNVKSILHALNLLSKRVAYRKCSQQLLYEKDIKYFLKDLLAEAEQIRLTPQKIVQSVASQCGISVDDLLGRSQSREYVLPRQIAMYLCRSHLSLSYMKIGEIFSRDHSTVISSIRLVSKALESGDREISLSVKEIIQSLFSGHKELEYVSGETPPD